MDVPLRKGFFFVSQFPYPSIINGRPLKIDSTRLLAEEASEKQCIELDTSILQKMLLLGFCRSVIGVRNTLV